MSTLWTPRLQLRRLRRGDLDALCVLEGDPAVMRTTGLGRAQSRAESEQRLERTVAGAAGLEPLGVWGAVGRTPGAELLGWGMLRPARHDIPELGYMVARAQWGRGLATELAGALVDHARTLGIPRLVAHTDVDNAASVRVLEKLGFTRAGESAGTLTLRWLAVSAPSDGGAAGA